MQTVNHLRNSDKFSKGFVADRHKEVLFCLPNFVAAADLVSMGVANADLDEVAAFELGGIECANTESYSTLWVIPDEIDLAQAIDVRVLSCDEGAATANVHTVTATYQAVTVGTDAMVAPATAIGTAIVGAADLAAGIPQWSTYGTIAGGTIADTPGEDLCNWKFTWTIAGGISQWMLAAQVRYFRRFLG